MLKVCVGVKKLPPPQRRRTPPRLKVMWSGQGRHRLKMIFHFGKMGTISLPLLAKIWSRYWSRQILDTTEVRFSAISAICFIADVVIRRLLHLRLSAPFLQMVLAWGQVPCTFLQRCRPQVGFFGCLSYGHVKVSRNSFLRQHLGTAANPSSVLLPRLSLYSLVSFLFAYVVSFSISLFQLFIVHCTVPLS